VRRVLVALDRRELLARRALQGPLAAQALPVLQDGQVPQALRPIRAQLVLVVAQGPRAPLELLQIPVRQAILATRVIRAPPVTREIRAK
jgi:hypothetical protein